jgi:hypothetical protein
MIKALPVAGYTLPTAARLIGCHPKSIYRIAKRGDLETFVDASGRLMVSREEVYAYVKRKGEQQGKD